MSKLLMALTFLLFCLCGCSPSDPNKEILAKIDNYSLYTDDFVSEIRSIPYFKRAGKTKEELLDDLLEKKILLLEAQREGLDKQADFMKMVERFWEQSLLRIMTEKKIKEFLEGAKPDDERGRKKVQERFRDWLGSLRQKSKVSVNKEALERLEIPSGD